MKMLSTMLVIATMSCADPGDAPRQAELVASVCDAFGACGSPDCPLEVESDGLPACPDFIDALTDLDAALSSDGCDACAGGHCSFDDPYARAVQALRVCALLPGGDRFPDSRGYRCKACAENDAMQLCANGFAAYLQTDIVYDGAYAIDGPAFTLALRGLDEPLHMTLEDDGAIVQDGSLFVRDDTVSFVDCH